MKKNTDIQSDIKVSFQDQGQDLLWFKIDAVKRIVTEAGPYHNDIYAGAEVRSPQVSEGEFIDIFHHKYGSSLIKYPIIKIELIY